MKFKQGVEITTDDFWYDLFEGGYIKPDEILERSPDITKVENAIELIKRFKDTLEEKELINWL